MSEAKWKACGKILQKMLKQRHAWVFSEPVDPVALDIPNYYNVIKNPMDLGTIQKKLDKTLYDTPNDFAEDVRLVFDNALTFNAPKSDVANMAKALLDVFEKEWSKVDDPTGRTHKLTTPPQRSPIGSPQSRHQYTEGSESGVKRGREEGSNGPNKRKKAEPITFEEKLKMSETITKLPSAKLADLVDLIRQYQVVQMTGQETEIEFDLEVLDNKVLRAIKRFLESETRVS